MAGSPTIKGDNTVLFGSGGLYASGIIAGGSLRLTSEKVLVPDNNGFDVAKVYFNNRKEGRVRIIVQTAAPALAEGDEVSIKSEAGFLVEDPEEVWEQKGVRMYSFTAVKHMGMTLA